MVNHLSISRPRCLSFRVVQLLDGWRPLGVSGGVGV